MPPKKISGRGRPKVVEEKIENGDTPVKARGRGKKVDSKPVNAKLTEKSAKGTKKLDELKMKDIHNLKEVKVSLQHSEEIDKILLDAAKDANKKNEKGGSANNSEKKGKRARSDSIDDMQKDTKPAKIPKESGKSKGQSKSDKMPDVTLLDFSNDSLSSSGKAWNLKLSSWNINGIRAWLEKDGLEYLKHENPDILCVQETKCSDDKLPEQTNVAGYHTYWLAGDKDGYSGVGLLSKIKPTSVKYGIEMEEHDKEGRVITAEYEKFFLINAYVPNAGRKLVRLDYRMQWDKDFCTYLKSLDKRKPIILCGDLNVAHEEIDLANPKTNKRNAGFTEEERGGFSALLSEGFVDTFRHLYPDKIGAYTFWTYMMNARAKNVGWRLDYFVMSKKFTENLCDNVIRKDVMGSDHCPITLFLSV